MIIHDWQYEILNYKWVGEDAADMKAIGYSDEQIAAMTPEERKAHLEMDKKVIAAQFYDACYRGMTLEEKEDLLVFEKIAWELFNKRCEEMGVESHSCKDPFQGLMALASLDGEIKTNDSTR